jgi:peroxin-10
VYSLGHWSTLAELQNVAIQTLGHEYTDTWQYSKYSRRSPTVPIRAALVLIPALSSYIVARWKRNMGSVITTLVQLVETGSEINLAIFYLRGDYYDILKRILGIKQISSLPQNPYARPPSYALLGLLILIRVLHRIVTSLRKATQPAATENKKASLAKLSKQAFIDGVPVSSVKALPSYEDQTEAKPAEDDEGTMLNISAISPGDRAGRNCTLCLEERTDSCATECGHLFCWPCIVGWGREKVRHLNLFLGLLYSTYKLLPVRMSALSAIVECDAPCTGIQLIVVE